MGKRIKADEIAEERFYKIPKAFFLTEKYKNMHLESKVLYGFLKDRSNLSLKNKWIDKEGSVYLIFSRKAIQEMLCLSDKPVTRAFKELKEYGLIEEEQQGLNKPNLIYVCHIEFENIEEMRIRKNYDSGIVEDTNQESDNIPPIETDVIYTDSSETDFNIIAWDGTSEIRDGIPKGNTKSLPYHSFLLQDIKKYDTKYKSEIVEFIIYYNSLYLEHVGEEHKRYKQKTLKEVYSRLDTIFSIGIQDERYNRMQNDIELDTLKELAEKHFNTKYSKKISWTLLTFLNDKIMVNRYYELYGAI